MKKNMIICFYLLSLIFVSACNEYNEKLWSAEKGNYQELTELVGTFNGEFNANIAYLSFYDHPTITVDSGSRKAKFIELNIVQKPSAAGIRCDAEGTSDHNVTEVASDITDISFKKLTFRRVSLDSYFYWRFYQNQYFHFDESYYVVGDSNGNIVSEAFSPAFSEEVALGATNIKFINVDPDNKLLRVKLDIYNPDAESADEAQFQGETNTFSGLISGEINLKYCDSYDLQPAE